MRHLKAGKRLGITTSHRKALMRNLVTALLEHGEIKTTITRAKEMRKYFDKMIGLGKRNDLHARRQALRFIKSREAFKKLFEDYGLLYEERNGGYTRIYKIGRRLGDNAQMALIQMVDLDGSEKQTKKEPSEPISEIKTELEAKNEAKSAEETSKAAKEDVTAVKDQKTKEQATVEVREKMSDDEFAEAEPGLSKPEEDDLVEEKSDAEDSEKEEKK